MRSPFPWFGGKRRVAGHVWAAMGDVQNYVEPFAGSLAVLLGRPEGWSGAETINDLDCFVANFWRALKSDPSGVAEFACDPVNEADLVARHVWLVNEGRGLAEQVQADPHHYSAKVAGWWVWGICAWIGSGWCSGSGPWVSDGKQLRQRPHLGNAGQGVNRQLPHLGDAGRGAEIAAYLAQLAQRLERTRVCCGDWSRVVTDGALSYPRPGPVGVFLDPPYLGAFRTKDLYREDDCASLANEVREWCLANGSDPRLRIVLAGYADEHEDHMPVSWRRVHWSASRAYGTASGVDSGNRHKETLWLSPYCVGQSRSVSQPGLFQ